MHESITSASVEMLSALALPRGDQRPVGPERDRPRGSVYHKDANERDEPGSLAVSFDEEASRYSISECDPSQ